MKILLDTHTLIWFYQNARNLSLTAKNLIESTENESYISMATLWEMAIKTGLGKLEIGSQFEKFVEDFTNNGIQILSIETKHIFQYRTLPFHHGDPFDRMIVAQALVDKMDIISIDAVMDQYLVGSDLSRLW